MPHGTTRTRRANGSSIAPINGLRTSTASACCNARRRLASYSALTYAREVVLPLMERSGLMAMLTQAVATDLRCRELALGALFDG